jgi:hypothetical protein
MLNGSMRLPIYSFIGPVLLCCVLSLAVFACYRMKRACAPPVNPSLRLRSESISHNTDTTMDTEPSTAADDEDEFVVTRRRLETLEIDFSGDKNDRTGDNYAALDNQSDAQSVQSEDSLTSAEHGGLSSGSISKGTSSTRPPPLETVWSGIDPYNLKSQESLDDDAEEAAFVKEMDLISRLSTARTEQ